MRIASASVAALALTAALAASALVPEHEAWAQAQVQPETWRCERISHPLVDFHTASLTLAPDGTFELHHTHTTPEGGWSTWLRGTYARAPSELVLTPVTALRRVWVGDMHRQEHGEDVGARQWEETVSTAPWRLPRTDRGGIASLDVHELHTHLYRWRAGEPTSACDAGLPPRRPR